MSRLTLLKFKRDKKIDEKNASLRLKWDIQEKLSQIDKEMASAQNRNDILTIRKLKLREKKFLNELYSLNKTIRSINEELDNFENLMEQEKFIEINSAYINDRNLSDSNVEELIGLSNDLSEKYQATIDEYSKFLKKLESYLKGFDDETYKKYLIQIRDKIETQKEWLLEYKEQCIEFDQLESLKHNLFVANRNLQMSKTDFSMSKRITINLNDVFNEFIDFLNDFDSKVAKIDKKFRYPDLDKIHDELQSRISDLPVFKKQCFESNRLDDLNDAIGTYEKDLARIKDKSKNSLNKSKNLSRKFDDFMEYYMGLLNTFNSKLEEVEEDFWHEDFHLLKNEMETKVDSLMHFLDLCVEHGRLDDFGEAITNTRRDLLKIMSDFNESIGKSKKLSIKFYSTITDYNEFLSKLDKDLKEIDDEFLVDVFSQMIVGTKTKLNDLYDYKEIYSENKRVDDLNEVIDIARDDLVKIKGNFAKTINKKLRDIIIEAESIIQIKSAHYSELDLKLSDLIDNANKLGAYTDKQELMDNLDETKMELNQLFQNLQSIGRELHDIVEDSLDVQLINDEIDRVNDLIDRLDDLNFKKIENMIDEGEKAYDALSELSKDIDSDIVEYLLNELNKLFSKPMFMRQLKRYGLDDDELKIVKNEIRLDIINQEIEEGADIKKIVKTRCREFRKNHAEIEDGEIDMLLENVDVKGIDEEIVDECKNKVMQDLLEGNVTRNNIELKFSNYLNKKVNESAQLDELDRIKSNPDVPSIKIHLTPEETDEIYVVTEKEILSEYGIRGNVENHVYYLISQKIRENQSEARGRLNTIKRDFSTLTQLNKSQQTEFIHQIEFYINTNEIKYYDISEDYIVKLSYDFINYGKIRLR